MNNNIPVGDKYRMHRLYNNNPPNNKISTNRLVTQHNQYKNRFYENNTQSNLRNNSITNNNIFIQPSNNYTKNYNKIAEEQEQKKKEALRKLKTKQGKEDLVNILLGTQKISKIKDKNEISKVSEKIKDLNNEYKSKSKLKKYWNTRTNQPYKNIIIDEKHINPFYQKGKISTRKIKEDELIVHTVTEEDSKQTDNKYKECVKNITQQNNEMKKIYSDTNKKKHYDSFTYSKVYGKNVPYKPSSHNDMNKMYKKENKSVIKGTLAKNNIVDICSGIENENENENESENEKKSNPVTKISGSIKITSIISDSTISDDLNSIINNKISGSIKLSENIRPDKIRFGSNKSINRSNSFRPSNIKVKDSLKKKTVKKPYVIKFK